MMNRTQTERRNLTDNGSLESYYNQPTTVGTSLIANNITAKPTKQFQRTRLTTPSTDRRFPLDSEHDLCSGFQNARHQQQLRITLTRTITPYELLIILGSNHLLNTKLL